MAITLYYPLFLLFFSFFLVLSLSLFISSITVVCLYSYVFMLQRRKPVQCLFVLMEEREKLYLKIEDEEDELIFACVLICIHKKKKQNWMKEFILLRIIWYLIRSSMNGVLFISKKSFLKRLHRILGFNLTFEQYYQIYQ